MGLHAKKMNNEKLLVDTGAGHNLIKRAFIHPTWALRVKRWDFVKLRSANKQTTRSERVILLNLQLGNIPIRVWF